MFFTRDPELDVLLPAPGFPQTLHAAGEWRAFLDQRGAEAAWLGTLPAKGGGVQPARGIAIDAGTVAVLLGAGAEDAHGEAAVPLLTLLVALFDAERRAAAEAARAAAADIAVERSAALTRTVQSMRDRLEVSLRAAETAQSEAAESEAEAQLLAEELRAQTAQLEEHVTELRRAEQESRQAAERIRLQADMLAAVAQAVVATDIEGRITYWNDAAETVYGWARQEALGTAFLETMSAEYDDDAMAAIFVTLREGGTWTGELDLRRRDGSTFRGSVTAAPILDDDGALTGVIGVSSDITEQRQLAEQLRQAQRLEAVGRLAGGIAHDFNNLLTAVKGHATIVLDDLPAESPFREDVGQILKAGARAADLTRQLLAFSRRQVLQEQNVDLSDVAVELEKMLSRLVPERIRFRVACGGKDTVVRADPGQLHQVVMNLVMNAVDAIEAEGSITVEVDPVDLDMSDTSNIPWHVEPGPYVRLSVHDTGAGMPPEILTHLFEPFFTTKREGHGSGLGLATVYGIVKQSGGHILLESEPGRGSTFRILLPRVSAKADPGAGRPAMISSEKGGVVLLVEDDEAVRTISRRILTRAGYTVLEAAGGREALERVHDGVDLVISDIVMPGMGGLELHEELAQRYPDLKVILTSGYSEANENEELRNFEAPFLPKPFTPQSLVRLVEEVLRGSTPPDG